MQHLQLGVVQIGRILKERQAGSGVADSCRCYMKVRNRKA